MAIGHNLIFYNMRKISTFFLVLFFSAVTFTGCKDDDDVEELVNETSEVSFTSTFPDYIDGMDTELYKFTLTVTNVNSGIEKSYSFNSFDDVNIDLEDGLYNFLGEVVMGYDDEAQKSTKSEETDLVLKLKALQENVTVQNGELALELNFFLTNKQPGGFVISEIFFAGTKTPEDVQYNDDKFIEIYNNSLDVLYADGLCIAETEFNTAMDESYGLDPDNRSTHVALSSIYKVPGNGTEHPIQPGETLLLCDLAIDHTVDNANSFDLSGADFEWYDDSEYDQDVPEVPNMIKMSSTSASVWTLHNRGFKSYVLFRLDDVTPEQFVADYAYSYEYIFEFNGTEYPMGPNDAWEIPNDIVIDAVECSTESKFEWKALDPSLDISWTHSGDADDARYGKSVKRKVEKVVSGRKILQDTNDSANDFIPTADPTPGYIGQD